MTDRIRSYRDARGEWRWRRTDPEGRVIGAATEGYHNAADMTANALRVNGQPTADTWLWAGEPEEYPHG